MVGKGIDFEGKGGRLIENVQWGIDVAEARLGQLGWKLTEAGFLKAVSVGFIPVKSLSREGNFKGFKDKLKEMGREQDSNRVQKIFLEQQQYELSSVIVGANPNALLRMAKAYKAEVIAE